MIVIVLCNYYKKILTYLKVESSLEEVNENLRLKNYSKIKRINFENLKTKMGLKIREQITK